MNSNLQTIEPERLPAAITPSGLLQLAVQTRIARMSDSELGELALHASPLTASVELATLRLFGALIRAALRRPDATQTDDERVLGEYVRETIEEESRHA